MKWFPAVLAALWSASTALAQPFVWRLPANRSFVLEGTTDSTNVFMTHSPVRVEVRFVPGGVDGGLPLTQMQLKYTMGMMGSSSALNDVVVLSGSSDGIDQARGRGELHSFLKNFAAAPSWGVNTLADFSSSADTVEEYTVRPERNVMSPLGVAEVAQFSTQLRMARLYAKVQGKTRLVLVKLVLQEIGFTRTMTPLRIRRSEVNYQPEVWPQVQKLARRISAGETRTLLSAVGDWQRYKIRAGEDEMSFTVNLASSRAIPRLR